MSDYGAPALAPVEKLRPKMAAPTNVAPAITAPARRKQKFRTWWIKQFRTWHWVSAAVSLVGVLLFAITGLTLNHAATITDKPKVTQHTEILPPQLLALLKTTPGHAAPLPDAPLPDVVAEHLKPITELDAHNRAGEWTDDEVYVAMPGPGRDSWISIDRQTGAVKSENTDRGWVSYFNDLHKGRNTGSIWFWFIDAFAGACILFTITGLLLLNLHAKNRPSTWPLVGLSLLIPLVIAILFIH
jgi:hypothetical protein